jgi:hypothetical protein
MSLSRRKFTKEFKEAAVRRLALGALIAEVARACEANSNVLHRWRRAALAVDVDMDLRDEIQRIARESPCYGWRRSCAGAVGRSITNASGGSCARITCSVCAARSTW